MFDHITVWDVVKVMSAWFWLAWGIGLIFGQLVRRGHVR